MSEQRRISGTQEPFDAPEEQVHPIQFVQIGSLPAVPVPLARITTCGRFQFQVLHEVLPTTPPQGRYREVTLKNRPKGSGTALILLKILSSLPEHATSTDWLSEHLSGNRRFKEEDDDEEWERGMTRVDNVAGYLRGMLCPLWMEEQDKRVLRKLLVKTLRNHRDSGTSYQLATAPLVWLDVDEIAEAIRLACLREERGKDALPSWEQAYTLASRGPFLPNEPYSDWATARRTEIDGYLRQSVHALRQLLPFRYGEASENRVILLLRQYWHTHITDEEALQQLMELLSKHGSLQEAQEYYQRLCEHLKEEGDKPDRHTQEVAQNLVRFHFSPEKIFAPLSHIVTQGIMESDEPETQKDLPRLAFTQNPDLEGYIGVDRREASRHLGLLGLTLFTVPYRLLDGFPSMAPKRLHLDKETLTLFRTLTETCLQLSEGNQLATAERVLWSYLPEIEAFAQQPSEYQYIAANIVSQGYLIAASLVGHRNNLQARQYFSEQAWCYGSFVQDCNLQVAALRQLAVTFDYLEQPQKVLHVYQQALPYLDDVSPRLRACIYAALSGVYAQMKQKQEAAHFIGLAYDHFSEKTEDEPNFLRLVNANHHTILLWDGLNSLELDQPEKAEKIFASLDVLTPSLQIPERIRIELLNYRSKAFTAVKNMEQACIYLEVALHASIELQSQRRLQEAFTIFQQIRQQWSREQRVQQLGDLFFHALVNHTK